ncbi:flagellar export protein FliJ [Puniceicoccaceae bacterium K14]|nr:flagellar export protein FliJ [Puniceicoccaceae bacterium K14]
MKKFKFQLESLMTLRERNEQIARQALAGVLGEIEDVKRNINELKEMRSSATEQWVSSTQEGFSNKDRVAFEFQIQSLEQQSLALEQSLKNFETKRQQAFKQLEKASQEKRIVERMKEKRFLEYTREAEKQEANEIEDIFNARRKGVWS